MTNPFIITRDTYFHRKQPAKSEELKNRVEVQTQPLHPADEAEELYRSGELIELEPSTNTSITAYYSTQPAMVEAPYSPSVEVIDNVGSSGYTGGEFQISEITYYAWGAQFTVENVDVSDAGSGRVVIEGYPLNVSGEETIISEDSDSIRDYGLLKYALKKNHLIQSKEMAELIADNLLSSYKTFRKDVTVTWRGNPVLELGDVILVTEYRRDTTVVKSRFKITKNRLTYDGSLKEVTSGRKIGSTAYQDSDTVGSVNELVFQDTDVTEPSFILQG